MKKDIVMTQIEQIKAEIKRLKKQLIRGSSASLIVMETSCKEEVYNELLSFIESLEKEQDAPKIKGWVARDKRGTLNFFRAHPRRITDNRGEEYWIGHVRMKQPNEFFTDIKWEDEPIEVELTLNRI